MMRPRPQGSGRRWPRLPRRTARLRLTALYGGLFLACGAVLLAVSYVLVEVTGYPTAGGSAGRLGNPHIDRSAAAGQSAAYQVQQLNAPLSAGQLHQLQLAQQADDIRVVNAVLRELLIRSPVALAIVTVVALLAGWIVAGRILRPLANASPCGDLMMS
jgi:hypothetical protein